MKYVGWQVGITYQTKKREGLNKKYLRNLLREMRENGMNFISFMKRSVEMKEINIDILRSKTIEYIESMRVKEGSFQYRYGSSTGKQVLYASCYAVMTKHLYNDLKDNESKKAWANYINSFQADDGLFKDPVVSDSPLINYDWWGWRHLTSHAVVALSCLGSVAEKEFIFLRPFYNPDFVISWLEGRDWSTPSGADNAGNEVLNYGQLLQYARDFHNDTKASKAVEVMLEWLKEKQNPLYGAWGPEEIDINDRMALSDVMMGGYHEYLLFFYDRIDIRYKEVIIDRILSLQNEKGGFTGPHHPVSSACQDIDCIDPLVRLSFQTDYKREEIKVSIERAVENVISHQNPDGGFVFSRGKPFIYGHKEMSSLTDESSMFATWFRTLSLAVASKVLLETDIGRFKWQFTGCPGYQFWREG